eukprot:SAG11_NODE_2253_length_3630_cov_9.405551_2_plen_64_part_00
MAMTKKRAAIETWRVRQEEEAVACLAREEMNKALALEDYQGTPHLTSTVGVLVLPMLLASAHE